MDSTVTDSTSEGDFSPAFAGTLKLRNGPGWNAKVQRAWAERPVEDRVRVLRRWRRGMSGRSDAFCVAIAGGWQRGEGRTPADVRVSEILPLLAACEYLERQAAKILKPQCLGWRGRPVWLWGVESEIRRVALGRVLVIGPANYPLFLPGVQVLQALTAGNSVTWKPGRGGRGVAKLFAEELDRAGLPRELLHLTEETDEAGREAVAQGADKVFFTGSAGAGRAVMRELAETATPSVMELSGCSAVVVLPRADLERVTLAIGFGMRLNGSATCMAPRRALVMGRTPARREALRRRLEKAMGAMEPVRLSDAVYAQLWELIDAAEAEGARVFGVRGAAVDGGGWMQAAVLLTEVKPAMRVAQADIFAPVLSMIDVATIGEMAAAQRACPYALSVSIFGEEQVARRLADRLIAGTVLVNDVIVPTADPRIPFGGRRGSGFGVTRGAEGLLEMTAVKTVLVRRGVSRRQYEETGEAHTRMFDGLILAGHAPTWGLRWQGLRQMVAAAMGMRKPASVDESKAQVQQEMQEQYDGE
jgi:acyl-CoA reductase-like NAD-dependent aldehyde dehydrogenase